MTTSTLAGFEGMKLGANVGSLGVGRAETRFDVGVQELFSSITVIGFCFTRPMIADILQQPRSSFETESVMSIVENCGLITCLELCP